MNTTEMKTQKHHGTFDHCELCNYKTRMGFASSLDERREWHNKAVTRRATLETGIGIAHTVETSPNNKDLNLYKVLVDGEVFCFTENDDDGFNLQVAINELYLKRGILNYA